MLDVLLNPDKRRIKQLENFIFDLCKIGGVEKHMDLIPVILSGRVVLEMPHDSALRHGCADITKDYIFDEKYFGKTPYEAFLQKEKDQSE